MKTPQIRAKVKKARAIWKAAHAELKRAKDKEGRAWANLRLARSYFREGGA